MQEKPSRQSKLSVVSALKFFLKGNLLFVLSSVTIYSFDIPTRIFPSLFQQVYIIMLNKKNLWDVLLKVIVAAITAAATALTTTSCMGVGPF